MIESQIRALFAQLSDDEPAPSRVDTQLARRRGRTRLRWRRAGTAGTSVVAAAVAVALTAGAAPARPGGTGPAASGTGPATAPRWSRTRRSAGCPRELHR